MFLFFVSLSALTACSKAPGLVGLWETDRVRVKPPGYSDFVEAYETVQFFKEGSFKFTEVTRGNDGKALGIPMSGTFTIVDNSHLRLEVATNYLQPDSKTTVTVSFNVSGNQLELDAIPSSVIAGTKKYHKVGP